MDATAKQVTKWDDGEDGEDFQAFTGDPNQGRVMRFMGRMTVDEAREVWPKARLIKAAGGAFIALDGMNGEW